MRISVSPMAAIAGSILFYLDREGIFPLFLLAAALHEATHLLAVALFEGSRPKNCRIDLGLFGGQIFTGFLSPGKEALAIAAGPLTNLLIFFAVTAVSHRMFVGEKLLVFAGINLVLGIYNLLPVLCLDGGRLVQLGLEALFSINTAEALCLVLSFLVIALMGTFGLLLSYRYGAGFGLIMAASWLAMKHLSCIQA